MRKFACSLALLLTIPLAACEPGSIAPTLEAVAGAIDARRAMACADELGKYDDAKTGAKAAATCLGVSVLSDAIKLALGKAAELGEQAKEAMGPAGADDMSEDERQDLASELHRALSELSAEVAGGQ